MTVERVFPCVCVDHEPDASDCCDYGMPKLYVANSTKPHRQFWMAYCPNCKRGLPGHEVLSPYKALKQWNELQRKCWGIEYKEFWSGEFKEDTPEWVRRMMVEMKKDEENDEGRVD